MSTHNPEQSTPDFLLKPNLQSEEVIHLALGAIDFEQPDAEENRRLFEAAFEHTSICKTIVRASGRFYAFNQAFCNFLGYDRQELGLLSIADLSLPEDYAEDLAQFQLLLEGKISSYQIEKRYIHKSGKTLWGLLYVTVVRNAAGAIEYLFGEIQDITQSKRLESEHARLEEQLRQAQKIEAIGKLAGSVAHDFNNLLTVINGFSELLLADQSENSPTLEALQQIYQAGQRAAALTSQLLAFGRKSILKPSRIALNSVILKLEKMLKRLLREDIEIELQLGQDLAEVLIDPTQFEQVVMNLVINARDALPTGGLVLIQTAMIQLDESYDQTHAEVQVGRYLMLAVSDNGIGMDETTREQIFEPFYTTKQEGQGTGLGLSTVHGIVSQSGGHIFVYSEPGLGTTFKIYFPADAEASSADLAKPAALALPEGSETVLLVEDVAEVRAFVRLVLESCGYRVIEAASSSEALALYPGHQADCRLLISDVIMPRMSGAKLAEALQSLNPDLKVLYISGYTDDAVLRYGILTSGIHFLAKPFTPGQLAHKVREVLDEVKDECLA